MNTEKPSYIISEPKPVTCDECPAIKECKGIGECECSTILVTEIPKAQSKNSQEVI
jgi:hypothetical protein